MGARIRSWWQQIKAHPVATVLITLLAVVVVLIILIILGYIVNWGWTGLGPYISPPHPKDSDFQRGKTLWDWLQLLIIPAVLAVGGYVINLTISRGEQEATKQRAETEREISEDNQREAALQEYIDKMSELLLLNKLRDSKPEDEVRKIARIRTLTLLHNLDRWRKRNVLQFLYESGLIDIDNSIVDLSEADLRKAWLNRIKLRSANLKKANLSGADLGNAILSGADLRAYMEETMLGEANLSGANLNGAFLGKANLRSANLNGVNLTGADLSNANLHYANLKGAKVTTEQLDKAKSLQDATMPDGSIHP